ncbi:hypothetical protein FOA52_006081 [Chlamydomonas sp. UWO 241]|nr:hypothetical protein FOA52_006081 [Chlamydomonas sp. UWO 241]
METNTCVQNVATNFGIGATLGSSIGAVYGTFDAFRWKIPGIYKIRHIGRTTISTGAIFGTFLAAGALLHCGK